MGILRFSPTIQRVIRQDPPEQLGEPTRMLLAAAVRQGDTAAAGQWLDYYLQEIAGIHYLLSVWSWYMVRYSLERRGEPTWDALMQESMAPWLGTTAGLADQPVARVQVAGHDAVLTVPGLAWPLHIVEGDKRFNITLDAPEVHEARRAEWRTAIEPAMAAGNLAEFDRLLEVRMVQDRLIHDVLCDWVWALLTVIGRAWGETGLGDVQRVTEEPWVTVRYQSIRDITPEESLQLSTEAHRGHLCGRERDGRLQVIEEPDCYIIRLDACGSGARMVRGDPVVGSGSRLDAPYNFMMIKGAYAWTWQRPGVGAYCSHCAIVNQLLPIEWLGRPMRNTLFPNNMTADPCQWIIYKRPAAVPDAAYTSVGKTPPMQE